ncbi:MAG TPA: polysaccharide deacetylase family protein [Solirubrobacterales bacterium]|nr:polysaccharide deacetylase family protein [Solirubrobacterales bacterium]
MPAWPGGARGALCLSFDNLGVDEASSAAQALPGLLKRLGEHDLTATFFAEGVNAELDPGALQEIGAADHEVAYHAWRHETWGELTAAEQAENLARGIEAFAGLGLEIAGMRPPGGQLGKDGIGVLRKAGLSYCSPAGEGAGVEGGVALLPFQWRHVDATSMLPGLDPVREQMTGSPDPLAPRAFLTYLISEVERLRRDGGFMSVVLHLPLLAWLGEQNLAELLERMNSAGGTGHLWVTSCANVADRLRANPALDRSTTLDPTSWSG